MKQHKPVLLDECLEGLAIKPDGIYIDCTFGRGGHSEAILNLLNESGRLIAMDKDQEAVQYAKEKFANDKRFTICYGSFASIGEMANATHLTGKINGILLDLGVSSPQLDQPARGFSFLHEGPLDMRMDQDQPLSAAAFIANASIEEMTEVFREYGEERFAKRIATAIANERVKEPIMTTTRLAEIVKAANPKWEKNKHPATRVFQAIRIFVNKELEDLNNCLKESLRILTAGGRLVVISFHSLEDRIVKQFMRQNEQGEQLPRYIPIKSDEVKKSFQRIGKAIKPGAEEIKTNIRSRSAVLRIGEKLA